MAISGGMKKSLAVGLGLAVVGLAWFTWSRLAAVDRNFRGCVANLLKIGLALHEHHDTRGSFPKAAITDKQGRPGLSWRVAILPFLGEQALYAKFKLDEPWDSPANKPLLGEMPAVFACPSASRGDSTSTYYRAVQRPTRSSNRLTTRGSGRSGGLATTGSSTTPASR